MLRDREHWNNYGLCYTLAKVIDYDTDPEPYEDNLRNYPEIHDQKPKVIKSEDEDYWWDKDEKGMNKRVKVLEKAIAKLEK